MPGTRPGMTNSALLARKPQRWTAAAFHAAQAGFFARDVVARKRHHVLTLGQLNLEHHHAVDAERHLGRGQIKLEHAEEARVVDALDLLAAGKEAIAPRL